MRHTSHTFVNIFFPSFPFPQPTRQIHVVPKGQDTPSKTLLYSSGYDRPCDYNRHPSQLWHGIWDIPMKRNYKVGVNATLGCITTTEEKPILDLVYFKTPHSLWLIHVKHLEQCQTLNKYYWKWAIVITTGFQNVQQFKDLFLVRLGDKNILSTFSHTCSNNNLFMKVKYFVHVNIII